MAVEHFLTAVLASLCTLQVMKLFLQRYRDIGIEDFEKPVKQEFHTLLFNFVFGGCNIADTYRNQDIGMGYGILGSLVFHNVLSLYPISL